MICYLKSLVFIIILVALYGCERKPVEKPTGPQLPPKTTEGRDTFGCLVNGELWLPDAERNEVSGDYSRSGITIRGVNNNNDPLTMIYFFLEGWGFKLNYKYKLNSTIGSAGVYGHKFGVGAEHCYYITLEPQSGYVEFTRFDSLKQIYSGEFEFTAVKQTFPNDSLAQLSSCKNATFDTVRITKGRFDILN